MADKADGSRDEESTEAPKSSIFKRIFNPDKLLSKKILGTLLVLSMLGHVAYLVIERPEIQQAKAGSREVTLGKFFFANSAPADSSIRRVDFRLHVDLLAGTDDVARRRLEHRQSMVQQNVEQLLRRARAVDFTDPVLSELKRQLQETINETISLRGVSDVIITDLAIDRHALGDADENGKSKDSVAAHRETAPKASPNS